MTGGACGGRNDRHYSYEVYADMAMAERFDALRFSGPIGTLVADVQERVLVEFLGELGGRTVLDVGTGTGRAAIALARHGATVTGVDASPQMLTVAVRRAREAGVDVAFGVGDAHDLSFGDQRFDAAVSLRVLMHTQDWRRCLAELCRVSRRRVVVDYPARTSLAAFHVIGRRIRQRLGGRTETYRVFSSRAIHRAFEANGFTVKAVHRQFVLPIALHKALRSRRLTRLIESALRAGGLLRLFGSPVTVLAERRASGG